MIYILDFGSQFSHLIEKRLKEMGLEAELVAHDVPFSKLKNAAGIILSGGPQNLSEDTSLKADKKIFTLGIPVLGICYGMQLMAHMLGGKVRAGKNGEYGPAHVSIQTDNELFASMDSGQDVWMSHGDSVAVLPKGFQRVGFTKGCPTAAMMHEKLRLYGIQFHAEVDHTPHGRTILKNFARICGLSPSSASANEIKHIVQSIKKQIGDDQAISAFSGGIDSVVASALVYQAIGKRLICIYVDTGLMRENETESIIALYKKKMGLNIEIIRAEKEFLSVLKNVTDPEMKRKAIGKLFIEIFQRETKRILHTAKLSHPSQTTSRSQKKNGLPYTRVAASGIWLVQGTLYTDAISSGKGKGKASAVIKSHHNVGGLPEKLGFKLMEPLRDMYKFEVRALGEKLKLPKEVVHRQPFPGPGLAVRIIGEVTKEKLDMVKKSDAILRHEIEKKNLHPSSVSQYFTVLTDTRSVGVQGDGRTHGCVLAIRCITTTDYLTADFAKLPWEVLQTVSNRITNEVKGINRVVYDITPKPPGTVEWE